jgi:ArsR family transcriptional regulator, lead/cadmium/zinc/bismuth-responsive transcriptional repressor
MFTKGKGPRPAALDERTAAHLAELFRTLGSADRVQLLSALLAQELSVAALAGRLGISRSALSRQLRGLRQMHLVQSRRVGQQVFYRIADESMAALLRQALQLQAEVRIEVPAACESS